MAKDLTKLRGLSLEELEKEETGVREEIWKLRMQFATGQLQDQHRVRNARRNLARILTIRKERELAEAKAQQR